MMMSLCDSCIKAGQEKQSEQLATQRKAEAEYESRINQVVLTTAPSLEGYRVLETLEIVSTEYMLGFDMVSAIFVGLTNAFGGRSETAQKALNDARKTCLYELKKEAYQLGANAVIAVDLDYSEFSNGGKSMLFLVASGTAVRVEALP